MAREVAVTKIFDRNFKAETGIVINEGGARSSKSHSIAQLFVLRFWNGEGRKMLVSRKFSPSLYLTAQKLVIDLLVAYGYYPYCNHDKSHKIIHNPRKKNLIAFMSVDDPEKIRSMDWSDAWLEEASEFTWDDFLTIRLRMSTPQKGGGKRQIFLSYNPDDPNLWIKGRIIESPAFKGEYDFIHSTYKDNPFLDDEYVRTLEALKDQDPDSWTIYGLGKAATLRHVIYRPYEVLHEFPESFDEIIYGLDFGFNNPTALLEIGIKDQCYYLRELLYETGLTNTALVERLPGLIPIEKRDCPIYADSAEPARIQEILQAGFNVHPAHKSVLDGIDYCQSRKFYTLADNVNLNKERASYKWRQDKNGNVLDKEPVKFRDHAMDSLRYGVFSHYKSRPGDLNVDQIEDNHIFMMDEAGLDQGSYLAGVV